MTKETETHLEKVQKENKWRRRIRKGPIAGSDFERKQKPKKKIIKQEPKTN